MIKRITGAGVLLAAGIVCSGFAQDADKIYSLTDGQVTWPAAGFAERTGTKDAAWILIPDEGDVQNFTSIRGTDGPFLQLQTIRKVKAVDAVLDYKIKIDEPGVYEIRFRASGIDKASDSAFLRIKELGDEYVQIGGTSASLRDIRWRTLPVVFEIKTPGIYTIQIGNREAGYCLLEFSLSKV